VAFPEEAADSAAAAPAGVGERMKTKELFRQLDHDRIVATIAEAEKHTSGEIRVYISHRKVGNIHRAAVHQFLRLEMNKTKHRNAVLMFVAPKSQNFAILGDEAVHAKCGEAFWEQVASGMGDRFRQGRFTDGIIHGIEIAGKLLAEHFPGHGAGHNELPDSIVER
jgi:uncharacterized membrane protein